MIFRRFQIFPSRYALAALMAASLALPQAAGAQDVPAFSPVSDWAVGSTELASLRGLENMKLPCVVSNEYDNGYVVRFSGGGGEMLAMAVDFRQNVFQTGKKYPASVMIGDAYMKQTSGSAIAPGALVFNLRELDGFYQALQSGRFMELDVQGNVFRFSLQQLSAAMGNLERCYKGERMQRIKPLLSAANAQKAQHESEENLSAAPMLSEPLPRTFDDILKADTNIPARNITPLPMRVSRVEPKVPAVYPKEPDAAPMPLVSASSAQWSAQQGEALQAVLSRWADKAGYDLQWQAEQGGHVTQDIALNGSFEQAVSQLLAESKAASGLHSRIEDDASSAADTNRAGAHWTGAAGANIQTVLEDWARREGVYVVWQDYMSIPLKNSINQSGTFETAVETLLDQYANEAERPVARLNADPRTGQRTLLMNLDRAS